MSRFQAVVESQAAQPAGAPVTTTFNGYFAAIVGGTAAVNHLRRVKIGCRAGATVPTSQQMTIAIYRQTVRVAGTGFSTVAFQNLDPATAPAISPGIDITTAATAGTTGPTISANKLDEFSFNTQSGIDIPYEGLEELVCASGNANGLAFVNIGNALPPAHLFTLTAEIEE